VVDALCKLKANGACVGNFIFMFMSMFLLRWKLLHTCLLELKFSFQLFLLNLSDSHMRWIVGCMCMDMVCAHECHGTVLLIFFFFMFGAVASC
jgi:hypothetical protein